MQKKNLRLKVINQLNPCPVCFGIFARDAMIADIMPVSTLGRRANFCPVERQILTGTERTHESGREKGARSAESDSLWRAVAKCGACFITPTHTEIIRPFPSMSSAADHQISLRRPASDRHYVRRPTFLFPPAANTLMELITAE